MITTRPRSITPSKRWRSARRRSSEKSARQIRRETPAFWRIHTRCSAVQPDGSSVIQSVDPGYFVAVDGQIVSLPAVVFPRSVVTLRETTAPALPRTLGGQLLADIPPPWLKKGETVYYRSDASQSYEPRVVLSDPFQLNACGQWVTLISRHRGWVPVESIRQIATT